MSLSSSEAGVEGGAVLAEGGEALTLLFGGIILRTFLSNSSYWYWRYWYWRMDTSRNISSTNSVASYEPIIFPFKIQVTVVLKGHGEVLQSFVWIWKGLSKVTVLDTGDKKPAVKLGMDHWFRHFPVPSSLQLPQQLQG